MNSFEKNDDLLSQLSQALAHMAKERTAEGKYLPPSPEEVFSLIAKVAGAHRINSEDMLLWLGLRSAFHADAANVTQDELALLEQLKKED